VTAQWPASAVIFILGLILSPFLNGVINRVKAKFAGRRGQPLMQSYYDIVKLFRKGAVYSTTTSWVFKLSAPVSIASIIVALSVMPFCGVKALLAFNGDLIVLASMLGLARFCMVVGALDTGSSFEGMGSSREVFFSALAEPALLIGLAVLAGKTGTWSLSSMLAVASPASFELLLVVAALFIVFLCENARIPFDDPNTHLELTMIHEAMVLDHSGPDFALINYASALKLWLLGALILGILIPATSLAWYVTAVLHIAGMLLLAVVTGIVESVMARLRLLHVPRLLLAAGALSVIALLLAAR